jgi:hypothetical protein
MNYYVQLYNLKPGDELVVPKSGFDIIQHHALYIGYDHKSTHLIIHNNIHTGVSLISVDDFFSQVLKINEIIPFRGTNAERKILVQKALAKIGQAYNLINYNCEHFITEIKSGEARSRQLENAALTAAGIVLLAAIFGD